MPINPFRGGTHTSETHTVTRTISTGSATGSNWWYSAPQYAMPRTRYYVLDDLERPREVSMMFRENWIAQRGRPVLDVSRVGKYTITTRFFGVVDPTRFGGKGIMCYTAVTHIDEHGVMFTRRFGDHPYIPWGSMDEARDGHDSVVQQMIKEIENE